MSGSSGARTQGGRVLNLSGELLPPLPFHRVDWMRLRDLLFRDLYGLPVSACVRLSCAVIRSYLPIFGARCGPQGEAPRSVYEFIDRVEEWSEAPVPKVIGFPSLSDCPSTERDQNFINALKSLRKIVASEHSDAGQLAARTEWILWCCVLQRAENVWAADDPLAFAAERTRFELIELMLCDDADSERGYELKIAAQADYLRGREVDDNVPAAAAEWREWRRISALLEIEINRHPEPPDPASADRDFERRENNEYEDDDEYGDDDGEKGEG